MRKQLQVIRILVIALIVLIPAETWAADKVRLTLMEYAPLMGEKVKGYGIEPAIVTAAFKQVNIDVEYDVFPPARSMKSAEKGIYDGTVGWVWSEEREKSNIVFFSVARTPEREDKFHWITLMMRKPWAFYAKKGSGLHIKSLDDAKKVRAIGVMAGGIRDSWLQQQGFTNIDRVASHELNVAKLERKRVALIFYSPQGMAHTCRESGYDLDTFEIVLVPHSSLSYLAMSKNGTSEETVKQWQEAAHQMKEDGTFDQLAEKWAVYTREKNGIECEVKDGALNFWKE